MYVYVRRLDNDCCAESRCWGLRLVVGLSECRYLGRLAGGESVHRAGVWRSRGPG